MRWVKRVGVTLFVLAVLGGQVQAQDQHRKTDEELFQIETDLSDISSSLDELKQTDYSGNLDNISEQVSSLCSAFEERSFDFRCQP